MFRTLTAGFLAGAALLLLSTTAQALPIISPTVSIDADPNTAGVQSSITVHHGDTFDVDVWISDVDASTPLNGFEFDLFFDAAHLSAVSVVDGGFLAAPVFTFQNTIGAVSVEFAEVTLGPGGASGSGALATISFLVQGPQGASALDLQNVVLSASFGVPIATAAIVDGAVGVVPEPTGAVLFAVGLLVAGSRRRTICAL